MTTMQLECDTLITGKGDVEQMNGQLTTVPPPSSIDDEATGLRRLDKSRHMSSRQRQLELELATGTAVHEDDDEEDDYRQRLSSSSRRYVRCTSQDIADQDSGSSGSADSHSVPTNVYEQKGIPLPRRMSQSAGKRVQSATTRLVDQYAKDMTAGGTQIGHSPAVKPSHPVKEVKKQYQSRIIDMPNKKSMDRERELEEVRASVRRRSTMIEADEDEAESRRRLNSTSSAAGDIKCSKSLKDIRNTLTTKAETNKVPATHQNETLSHAVQVDRIRSNFLSGRSMTLPRRSSGLQVTVSPNAVKNAKNFYKNIEKPGAEEYKNCRKPTVRRKNADEVMANRRRSTYGSSSLDFERPRANSLADTTSINLENIRAARESYKRLETKKAETGPLIKPTAKVIHQHEVGVAMDQHKRRSENPIAQREAGDSNGSDGDHGKPDDQIDVSAHALSNGVDVVRDSAAATESVDGAVLPDNQTNSKSHQGEESVVMAEGGSCYAQANDDLVCKDDSVCEGGQSVVKVKTLASIEYPECNNNKGTLLSAELCQPMATENNEATEMT